ncbi:MAG: c-type cytochrome [Verrucomicrobiae bacterium]|nr:c-type cytochrome [Verrucomicrobiae bacterium]
MADFWLPALQAGKLTLNKQSYLIYLVRNHGGPEAAETVTRLLERTPAESQAELYLVLAQIGDASDLENALKALPTNPDLLTALYETQVERKLRPAGELFMLLQPAMSSEDPEVLAAAIHLVEAWKVGTFASKVRQLAEDSRTDKSVRHRALSALARLDGDRAVAFLSRFAENSSDRSDRHAASDALASLDLEQAATYSAELLADCQSEAEAGEILSTYLSRRGGSEVLATALDQVRLDPYAAAFISQSLTRSGRSDVQLMAVVNETLGLQAGATEYSKQFVDELVSEVESFGNAERGKEIYHSPLLNCAACHQLNGEGGVIGPKLTTVGSGLSTDLLVESVLWPSRQLKEGYFSVNVTTKDGRLYSGYRQREENGVLWLKDIATQQTVPVQLDDIVERNNVGTLMPVGLTASLSREELRDLIRFLSEQRGN